MASSHSLDDTIDSTVVTVVRNLANEFTLEADDSSSKSEDAEDDSVTEMQGCYEGRQEQWRGCVCDMIHPRPQQVFWIQCDGPCQSWYNVSEQCVGFDQVQAETLQSWLCANCSNKLSTTSSFKVLMNIPDVLIYQILKFCAGPRDRAAVLCQQISPLCLTTRHAVQNKWSGLWTMLLKEEYRNSNGISCWNDAPQLQQRCSKRRRRTPLTPQEEIVQLHLSWCAQTDDAHMALATMTVSQHWPLSLKRLCNILRINNSAIATTPHSIHATGGIRINKRSQSGRTFLHMVCAADYVDERVVLRCIKELVHVYHADPNVMTNSEYPDADRPVLFFAIARVMPNVVTYLIQNGASLDSKVTGHFRLISDPSERVFMKDCSPLSFAKMLKAAEATAVLAVKHSDGTATQRQQQLPPYWVTKLNTCIRILTEAEQDGTSKIEQRDKTF